MESLYLLIPIAIVLVFVAVVIFFWAVKSGQYDDLDTEGHRILFDDPLPPSTSKHAVTSKIAVAPELTVTPELNLIPELNLKPRPSEKKASTSKTETEASND